MEKIYSQIKPHKIPEEIVTQIKALIKDGKLAPGEKLPPERTLADLLGVGRSSLREAINILDALGFIEIKNRIGIFVRPVSSPIISDPMRQILEEDRSKLHELYELRKDIELASTYVAAKNRTTKDLAAMRTFLKDMERAGPRGDLSYDDDIGFHLAIARATRNFLRVHLLKTLLDLAADYMTLIVQKLNEEKTQNHIVIDHHRRIFEAVKKRDQEAARAVMEEHLTWVEDTWRAFGKP